MLPVLVLVAVGAGGMYYASMSPTVPPDGTVKSQRGLSSSHMFDFSETGIHYDSHRPQQLVSTSLNDAYAPYASPYTTPTESLPKVFGALADNGATVEAYGPNWYFNHWMEIPYTTAEQSTHNVEIPGPDGFKGGSTLSHYPRVWMEHASDKQFSHAGNMRAGQPTENEIRSVYSANKLSRDHNPYGGGGVFQKISGSRYAAHTARHGTNLAMKPNTMNFF